MAKQSKNRVKLEKQYRHLAVKTDETSHIAAAHLYFDKNENFWLIKSIHSARLKQLMKMELVWEK